MIIDQKLCTLHSDKYVIWALNLASIRVWHFFRQTETRMPSHGLLTGVRQEIIQIETWDGGGGGTQLKSLPINPSFEKVW